MSQLIQIMRLGLELATCNLQALDISVNSQIKLNSNVACGACNSVCVIKNFTFVSKYMWVGIALLFSCV